MESERVEKKIQVAKLGVTFLVSDFAMSLLKINVRIPRRNFHVRSAPVAWRVQVGCNNLRKCTRGRPG